MKHPGILALGQIAQVSYKLAWTWMEPFCYQTRFKCFMSEQKVIPTAGSLRFSENFSDENLLQTPTVRSFILLNCTTSPPLDVQKQNFCSAKPDCKVLFCQTFSVVICPNSHALEQFAIMAEIANFLLIHEADKKSEETRRWQKVAFKPVIE